MVNLFLRTFLNYNNSYNFGQNRTVSSSFKSKSFDSYTNMNKKTEHGIHKFVVPDAASRKQALGTFIMKESGTKHILQQVSKVFTPVDTPKEGNWLYSQKEPGQSYYSYQTGGHHKLDAKRKKIYIVPLQTNISKTFLNKLKIYCSAFYLGVEIVIHQEIDLKKHGILINQKRNQYYIKSLTTLLKQLIPNDAYCMIGILMSDLYHREDWNYLLGMGTKDRVGVFSFARYDPRFYSEEKYEYDYEMILEDAIGIMVHEITHMFGFKHCTFYNCLMNGIISVEESRIKPLELCPVCLRKLESNVKFDIQKRYEKIYEVMQEFCEGPRGKITKPMVGSILQKITKKK